ncbi:hypothetical protein GQ53DRAFT_126614 [Thozetella sp. PMI_491]|nr:hypothetical protein GQ53DRAFT_126614 [Thozetella sp. PMI_491]
MRYHSLTKHASQWDKAASTHCLRSGTRSPTRRLHLSHQSGQSLYGARSNSRFLRAKGHPFPAVRAFCHRVCHPSQGTSMAGVGGYVRLRCTIIAPESCSRIAFVQ